ncbi:hypothetical protein [Rossellomorea marisflavi]|uniref:hypothetical protein n=1 Tax=Rossellomorea marisflavi TaxID=189381 RepID=UPI00345ABF8E
MALACFESALSHYYAQSEVQRRPPDSYGNSGQGETLQARRSGSPHAPWKAGGRSETERFLHLYILTKNRMALACSEPALSPSSAQSEVQRRPPDSYGNSGQGETLQAAPKRLTARPMESGLPQRNETILSPPYTHKKQDGDSLFRRTATLPLLRTE